MTAAAIPGGAPILAVTGAAGFIGSHLVRGIDARGGRVVPFVRVVDGRAPAGSRTLEDAIARPALLEGVAILVHAASLRHHYGADAGAYRTANVDLVERTIRAAAAASVRRVVLVSSVGVYGFPEELPVTERHPYAPRTAYAATKVEAELRARRVAREARIELVTVRPTIVYGRGDRGGILDKMASMIRAGVYRVVGTGDNVLHHAHVDDVVEGLWLAGTRSAAAGEDFILAGPETTTLEVLSKLVARTVGRELPRRHVPVGVARAAATVVDLAGYHGVAFSRHEPPLNHEKLDLMTLPIRFSISKAREILGYAPAVGYEEGVRRTLRGEWPSLARAGDT
jgi:nucleoside-diphosphate-sugar epimerase